MPEQGQYSSEPPGSTAEHLDDPFRTYVNKFEQADHSPELLYEIAFAAEWIAKQKRFKPNGYVYILKSGPYCKIGRTSNPSERIKTLRIQLPFPVEVVNLIPCENEIAAEKAMHESFSGYRINGEWFKLPDEMLASVASWRVSIMSEIDGTGSPLFHETHVTLEPR